MSNAGQAILSIGGAAIGWVIGGPAGAAWGFQLGSLGGQAFFPTDLGTVRGPRLDDLRVMSSAIGSPIPIVYGTYAIAGNVIWSSGLIETVTKDKVGGKGGPTQTVKTYSYSVDFALGICEGEINGVRRIWADADLIYDISVQDDTESDEEYAERLAASDQLAAQMVVYTGSESQLADPTIEGYEGVGSVPAYRGLAYLVVTGFQLEKFGNRIPNFRVEVFRGTLSAEDCNGFSNEVLYPWTSGDDPRNYRNAHDYSLSNSGTTQLLAQYTGPSGETTDISDIYSAYTRSQDRYLGYTLTETGQFTNRMGGSPPGEEVSLYFDHTSFAGNLTYQTTARTTVCNDAPLTGGATEVVPAIYDEYLIVLNYTKLLQRLQGGDTTADGLDFFFAVSCAPEYEYVQVGAPIRIKVERNPSAPPDTSEDPNYQALAGAPGFYVERATGQIVRGRTWTYVTGNFKVLQKYAASGIPAFVTQYPLNPTLRDDDPNYSSQTFWEAAYAEAVANGEIDAGLTYGVDYPETQAYAYFSECETSVASTECIPVATVVQDLCARAGLTDVDVSDLSYCLEGYAVGRVMSARDAIDPLRSVALFDAVESGTTLKFVERGNAVVATLTDDDLCAHVGGEARPAAAMITRTQEKELPKSLRIHYPSPTRNYEQAEQSATRITTEARGASDIELAVALSDERASALAEILLYATWVGRNGYRFALSVQHLKIEPTDCVYLPVDGDLVRVRVISTEYVINGVLQVEAVRDDDGIYGLVATPATPVGSGGGTTVATLVCPVETVFIDIPGLRREDNDAGYYAATRSLCGEWSCAKIFRSSDGGTTYARVAEVAFEATIGEILDTSVPPPSSSPPQQISGSPLAFDEDTVIQVQLLSGVQLESATEEQLLAGANAAVIGAHGRWEIIQFRDATLASGDIWELGGLWRGLNGTEANMASTGAGDTFVLIDSAIVRLPATQSDIGVARPLKSVACGSTLDSTDLVEFTTAGLSYVAPILENLDDVTVSAPTPGQVLVWDGTQWINEDQPSSLGSRQLGAAWGSDSALAAASCADVYVRAPVSGTITGAYVLTQGGSGSCVIDVWKDSYANYPPTVADTITASAKPTISSGVKYSDTTLTGWTTSVTAGDILVFHVDSTSTFTNIVILLDYE